ncbi:Uu.00g116670.m01.CDS01 [Anthostomella pinea]|uniref:Uu.00g116670.m01.CDS01 n=1 Tax=Anthostomella pinea TaxID=933095 RepID=A0AAI8YEF7_9PEZI|nr:Uu.00g116670.m01.CDS01 [Anthostomella pinea]
MRFPTIQLVGLMGFQAVFGHPAPANKLHNDLGKRSAAAFASGNALVQRGIKGELYKMEITVGDKIATGTDGTVYKATVPDSPGFDSSTTFAYKTDYANPASVKTEYAAYKAIDGQKIGPGFEAIVYDEESENVDESGVLLEYWDTTPTDKSSKDHAKGAMKALKAMHDIGWVHGDAWSVNNVLVGKSDGQVRLVDFAKSEKTNDARKMEEDIDALKSAFDGVEWDGDEVKE